MRKKYKKLKCMTIGLSFILLTWLIFTILFCHRLCWPTYIIGAVMNPGKCYQKYVGAVLLEHGIRWNVEFGDNRKEIKSFKKYINNEKGFLFEYPEELPINVNKYTKNIGESIRFYKKRSDGKGGCTVEVVYQNGRVNIMGILTQRDLITRMIKNKKDIVYLETKNKRIVHVRGVDNAKKNDQYVGITFLNENGNESIHMTSYSCTDNFIKQIFSTFKFIE